MSGQNEFLSAESGPPSSEYEKTKHLSIFREMLLAGATKVRENNRHFLYNESLRAKLVVLLVSFFPFARVVDLTQTLVHGEKSIPYLL